MKNQENRSKAAADLRQKAEAIARERSALTTEDSTDLSSEEIRKILHELRVQQIELEMQNEELRIAHNEIEAWRARYFNLYDLAPVGYCTLSPNGLILKANLTAAALLGTARTALVKQPISRFILKDDQDIYYLNNKKVFDSGEPKEYELRLTKPDGTFIWAHLTATAAQDEDGAPVCRVMIMDITEHKQTEAKLADREDKYRSLFNQSTEGIYLHDLEGRILDVNEKACEQSGYSKEEWLSLTVFDGLPTQSRINLPKNDILQNWSQRVPGQRVAYEAEHQRKDGTVYPVEISMGIVRYGESNAVLAIVRDITERKLAEEELRKSKNELERTLEATTDGIWTWNFKTDTLFFSPKYYKMLGYEPNEFPADFENWLKLIHPDDREQARAYSEEYLKTKPDEYENEFRFRTKSNGYRWMHAYARVVDRDENGEAVYMIGNHQDFTERKRAEAEQKKDEQLLNSTFKAVDSLLIVIDKEHHILLSNWKDHESVPVKERNKRQFCYKVMKNLDSPCEGCPSAKTFRDGKSRRYKDQNPIDGSYKEISVLPILNDNGEVEYVLENVRDITERKHAEEKISNLSKMQSIILRIASEYINMPQELVDSSINNSLKEIGEFVQADRVYVFEYDWIKNVCNNTYEWCNEGIDSEIDNLQNVPNEAIDYWVETHKTGKEMSIEDVMQLPPNDGVRQILELQGVKSVLALPMMKLDKCIGFIGFDSVRKIHKYSEQEKTLLKVFAQMLVNIGNRKELERNLVQAKERTEKSEERFNLAMQASNDGIFDWNLETDEIYYSTAWKKMLGYEDHELPNDISVWENLTDPEDVKKSWELQQKVITKQIDRFVMEFKMTHKDGHRVDILSRAEAIFNDSGKAVRFVGTHTDITERKRAESELRRLYTAIEQSPETMVITDTEGTIQYVNPAFEKTTGYTCEEAIGQNPRILKSGQQDDEFYTAMWNTLLDRRVWEGRMINKRKDGSLYTEDASITPVEDSNGTIINYVGVKRDITQELKRESMYLQAQKMESVGRLAGGVAHDFNNMLMGIMGYTDICLDELGENHPIREWLDEIKHGAKRSADLTRQLLAFARKQTIVPKVLDLNDTVAGMLQMLRRLIGEDIDFSWQPSPNLWYVKLDPGQVDQILFNLCVNARDAIGGGSGKVTIETQNVLIDDDYCVVHNEAKPGPYVKLAISDDGCGMDSKTLAQVFEPFFTTKSVGEGTGLGLATVYGIVKQNEGFVNIYSEPGEGTTFRIYLPRFAGEQSGGEEVKTTEEHPGGSETVMLVEDEKSVRVPTARFLKQLGYKVLAAETPATALQLAAEYKGAIELLITDVVMPEMSGLDLAEKLAPDQPGMKILYISGYTANVIAHRGILEDNVEFLAKPFMRDKFARKVHEILKGKQIASKE